VIAAVVGTSLAAVIVISSHKSSRSQLEGDGTRRRLLQFSDPRTVQLKDPPVTSMSNICDYSWDMHGPENHYDSGYFEWQKKIGIETGGMVAERARQHLPIEGNVVADIGCGGGYALSLLTEAKARYCFEINEAAIKEHPSNVVSVSKWSQLENDSVDALFSHHSFEHHPHPLLSLQCAITKVKPGTGMIYLEVPMEHGGCNIGDNDYGRVFDVPNSSFHLYSWNPRLLGQFMHAGGLVDIQCVDLRPFPSTSFTEHAYHTMSVWCVGRRP